MKIVEPKVEFLTQLDGEQVLKHLELCARNCYKSEDKITEDSASKMVQKLIELGHEAMIEHFNVTVKLTTDVGAYKDLTRHRHASFAIESTRYCVAGDTKLKFKNPHNKFTIAELYNNVINSKNGSWKRLQLAQVNENTGLVSYSKIKNVFCNGEKETYRIKTKLGYELTCTKDHNIYTPNGYVMLDNINVGDKIYVNGVAVTKPLYQDYDWLYHQNITLNKTFVEIAKEFGFNANTLKKWKKILNLPSKGTGYFNIGRTPWNKNLSENEDSRVHNQAEALRKYRFDRWSDTSLIKKVDTSEYQKYKQDKCAICESNENLEVHHIDKNRQNNNPENLLTVCEKCHQRIHNHSLEQIFADEVISKEFVCVQKVYDIEMDEEYHNYNANGIIVHNCNYSKGKYGNELTFMKPINIEENSPEYQIWVNCMKNIEDAYNNMASLGAKADQLRMLLPHSTKADVIMTANLREWRHILNLRCATYAHPSVRQVCLMLLEEFHKNIPVVFDDIYNKYLGDK